MKISWKESKKQFSAEATSTDKRQAYERTIAIIKSLKKNR